MLEALTIFCKCAKPLLQRLVLCSEQILEQKKRALQAKEAMEQEHLRNVEADKQAREAERNQAKARRIVEAQRAQQRAALDLQHKTAYFQVSSAMCGYRIASYQAVTVTMWTAICRDVDIISANMFTGHRLSTIAAYHKQPTSDHWLLTLVLHLLVF